MNLNLNADSPPQIAVLLKGESSLVTDDLDEAVRHYRHLKRFNPAGSVLLANLTIINPDDPALNAAMQAQHDAEEAARFSPPPSPAIPSATVRP